jgi:hypothetical protein
MQSCARPLAHHILTITLDVMVHLLTTSLNTNSINYLQSYFIWQQQQQ